MDEGKIQIGDTTTDVCENIIKPETINTTLSYASFISNQINQVTVVEENQTIDKSQPFGTATHFVSHAWKYGFYDLVAALEIFYNSLSTEEKLSGKTFFWIDMFVVNQHYAPFRPHHWWVTTFVEAIRDFGKVILVFHPFLQPIPLTRVWCLWEIFTAISTGAEIEFAMPTAQWTEFRFSLRKNYSEVLDTLRSLDARNAEAFNPLDKASIFEAIDKNVGFDELNKNVRNRIAGILLCGASRESSRDLNLLRITDLLDFGADINTVATMLSPLGVACDMGCVEVVQLLLERGANVNTVMGGKNTALHVAGRCGYVSICKILLEAGANTHALNDFNRTPLEEIIHFVNLSKDSLVKNDSNDKVNKNQPPHIQEHENLFNAAFEASNAALNQLSKTDVSEAKSFSKAPGALNLAVECMCVLLKIKPVKGSDYWDLAKRTIFSKSDFLVYMKTQGSELINQTPPLTLEIINKAEELSKDPLFSAEKQLNCSKLGWALTIWCKAVILGVQLQHMKEGSLAIETMTDTKEETVDSLTASSSTSHAINTETLQHDFFQVQIMQSEHIRKSEECITVINEWISRTSSADRRRRSRQP